jgi:hypothetical protein
MSADKIFCYSPQRDVVRDFLATIGGAIITPTMPHLISEANQLRGLSHITFIMVDHHAQPIPQDIWEVITRDGAIVIHIDEQYRRGGGIIPIKHYPGDSHDDTQPR